MPKRVKKLPAYRYCRLEDSAPIAWKAQACRQADETMLPMTVYATNDLDMPWVINESTRYGIAGLPPCGPEFSFLPLVTYLPVYYFRS